MVARAEPVRVLIVDDEAPARELLRRHVAQHPGLTTVGEAASGFEAILAVEEVDPQVVLLDVQMPGVDGFGVLEELERRGVERPLVIFVTAYDRYAVRAFDAHAVDYLLKPVTPERFAEAVRRCLAQTARTAPSLRALEEDMLRRPPQRLLLRDRGRIVPVPVEAVDWVEAAGDYVRVHVKGRGFLLEKTLNEIEGLLALRGFERIHRGTLVNLERVGEIRPLGSGRYSVVLRDGRELVASRSYAARFRDALI
ncbi:MAG TPA: LytTR family DNA-binding domain-containing protein [Thermoanaerobaculia bacterium]|jgi:two-component system LytT family response regulator|nr:LytTR family DNA-binding domain-containing protein [Thermoanaerobaculia bacterium]